MLDAVRKPPAVSHSAPAPTKDPDPTPPSALTGTPTGRVVEAPRKQRSHEGLRNGQAATDQATIGYRRVSRPKVEGQEGLGHPAYFAFEEVRIPKGVHGTAQAQSGHTQTYAGYDELFIPELADAPGAWNDGQDALQTDANPGDWVLVPSRALEAVD